MTAQSMEKPAPKRPPRFSTYTEVEVDISARELEEAGWKYVRDEDDLPVVEPETFVDVVRQWHDDEHETAWAWCSHALCDRVRRLHLPSSLG